MSTPTAMLMTEGGSQHLGVGELMVQLRRSTSDHRAVWEAAESSPKPQWLEQPVPAGGQELIWAMVFPPVSDVMSSRRQCPQDLLASQRPCGAGLRKVRGP